VVDDVDLVAMDETGASHRSVGRLLLRARCGRGIRSPWARLRVTPPERLVQPRPRSMTPSGARVASPSAGTVGRCMSPRRCRAMRSRCSAGRPLGR